MKLFIFVRTVFVLAFVMASVGFCATDNPVEYEALLNGQVRNEFNLSRDRYCNVSLNGTTSIAELLAYSSEGELVESNPLLKPWVVYTLTIVASKGSEVQINLNDMGEGFRFYVDGKPSSQINYTMPSPNTPRDYGSAVKTFQIQMRLASFDEFAIEGTDSPPRAGDCSSIVKDKPIWYLSLGKLRNGESAGAVGFRQSNFSNSAIFTPAALIYTAPDPTEIEVIRDANGVIRQVYSRAILVDVPAPPMQDSYALKVYSRQQISVSKGPAGLWVPVAGEQPIIQYTIQKLASGDGIQITKSEDPETWTTSLKMSGTSWEWRDWRRSNAASDLNTISTLNNSSGVLRQADRVAMTEVLAQSKVIWGGRIASSTIGEASLDAGSGQAFYPAKTIEYYSRGASTEPGHLSGAVKSESWADGSWRRYFYNADGEISKTYRPWLNDSPADGSASGISDSNSARTEYQYTTEPSTGEKVISVIEERAPNGVLLGKTTYQYSKTALNLAGSPVFEKSQTVYADATGGSRLTTVSRYLSGSHDTISDRWKTISISRADGSKDSFVYHVGTWDQASSTFSVSATGTARRVWVVHGYAAAQPGVQTVAALDNQDLDTLYCLPKYSTISELVTDECGRVVYSGTRLFVGASSLPTLSGLRYTYDKHNRLSSERDVVRSVSTLPYERTFSYSGALLLGIVGYDGISSSFVYDDHLRQQSMSADGPAGMACPSKTSQTIYRDIIRQIEKSGFGVTSGRQTVE